MKSMNLILILEVLFAIYKYFIKFLKKFFKQETFFLFFF